MRSGQDQTDPLSIGQDVVGIQAHYRTIGANVQITETTNYPCLHTHVQITTKPLHHLGLQSTTIISRQTKNV